jgi:peptide subunit release factor 1 (eRF1)
VSCPFDGGRTEEVRDVVEEMVRIAEGQGAMIEFVDPRAVEEVRGVGALLRY